MENEKKFWTLVCKNLHGHDETYYFTSREVAKKNFNKIIDKYQDEDEFECNDNSCTWFDCEYNDFDTFIKLTKKPMPKIHDDILF